MKIPAPPKIMYAQMIACLLFGILIGAAGDARYFVVAFLALAYLMLAVPTLKQQ